MNEKEELKAAIERRMFTAFLDAGGLPLDPDSLESRRPPEPDLYCTVKDRPRRVELVEITDPRFAATLARSTKDRPTGGWFSDDQPLFKAISSKCDKTGAYSVDGEPLFLVAYYERQYPTHELDPELIPRIISGVAQSMVVFEGWKGLWVFDKWSNRILWRYPGDVASKWGAT